jgi:hypothetical protein
MLIKPGGTSERIESGGSICRRSWESYIKKDISAAQDFRRSANVLNSLWENHVTNIVENTVIKTRAVVETVWGSAESQCDGYSRVKSINKETRTLQETKISTTYHFDRPTPSSPPNPWDDGFMPFPTCEIRPDDCKTQWQQFQNSFSNWTTLLKDIITDFAVCTDRTAGIECPQESSKILDINSWIALRDYLANPGFFGGCPQPESVCLKNWLGLEQLGWGVFTPNGLDPGCDVTVERFVVMHFPPPSNSTRNLCSNETLPPLGAELPNLDGALPSIATLESIVFGAKSAIFGHAKNRIGFIDRGQPTTSMIDWYLVLSNN